jgi:hypothetical protein
LRDSCGPPSARPRPESASAGTDVVGGAAARLNAAVECGLLALSPGERHGGAGSLWWRRCGAGEVRGEGTGDGGTDLAFTTDASPRPPMAACGRVGRGSSAARGAGGGSASPARAFERRKRIDGRACACERVPGGRARWPDLGREFGIIRENTAVRARARRRASMQGHGARRSAAEARRTGL